MAIAFGLAFLIAAAAVWALASPKLAGLVLDIPNERSLHSRPVPRTGGIGLMLSAAITWLLLGGGGLWVIAALAGGLAAIFLIDDVVGLPVRVRFIVQALAAGLFVYATGPYPPVLAMLLIIGIVWSANLYNFMDGANGMAGGMALFGFGTYALGAWVAGATDIALLAAIMAGAAAGFLIWNFDPARIFLGDAGSIPLGFLAAAVGVTGWSRGAWPFWFPLLTFSPFVVDACATLAKRALRGEKLSQAHRSHYYQRLVRMGWSHRGLSLAEYALMATVAVTALLHQHAHPGAGYLAVAFWIGIYGLIASAIDRKWQAHGGGP